MAEYTPQSNATFELVEYLPASSEETTFEVGVDTPKVVQVSPADGAINVSREPTFTVETFDGAGRYQYIVTQAESSPGVPDFSQALLFSAPTNQFTVPEKYRLAGSTKYYWIGKAGTAQAQESYTETFNVTDQSGWVMPWATQLLSGTGTQEIINNKAVLSIGAPGISVARLSGITADNFDQYYRNQSFSTVGAGSEITYHFRTQGDWRDDNFITSYFSWIREDKISIGVIPSGQSPYLLGTVTFVRDSAKLYDIRTRGDLYRFRLYMFENGTTEPTEPTIEVVDGDETFLNGGFAVKLAGSVASNIAIDSVDMTFAEAGVGETGTTVTSFVIDQSDTTVSANGTRQLTTTTQGTNVSGGATWDSSNASVATVDNNGLVTWVSAGTVTITATSADDNTFTDTVQVVAQEESTSVSTNSKAGDEAFMQAFWDATQGSNLEVLGSTSELPPSSGSSRAQNNTKYLIGGDLYIFRRTPSTTSGDWVNLGPLWFDSTGWVNGDMSLDRANIAGVTTGMRNGELRIVEFNMNPFVQYPGDSQAGGGNNLVGTLCPEWGNLVECERFNIKNNHFTGDIPNTLQQGTKLQYLELGGQRADSAFPDLYINADYRSFRSGKRFEETNAFEGPIPTSFQYLTELRGLEIRRQRITGTIPSFVGNWTKLHHIMLNHQIGPNSLHGDLPSTIENWGTTLQLIDLDKTGANSSRNTEGYSYGPKFTGNIPQGFIDNWNNTDGVYITLRGNEFDGPFPKFMGTTSIRILRLEDNRFTGAFPIEYFTQGNNANMFYFIIENNLLSEDGIPDTMVPPTYPQSRSNYNNISVFKLGGTNDFTGEMPSWMQGMEGHTQVVFSNVGFSGPFPKILAEKEKVRLFYIQGNDFSGDLPDVDWSSDALYEVIMGSNNWTGVIPQSWSSMATPRSRGVWRLYMNSSQLEGIIPSWLANMPKLEWLYLNNNRFTYSHILPNYQSILSNLGTNATNGRSGAGGEKFEVQDQKPFNVPNESISGTAPVSVNLSSIDYANNVYQWQRLVSGTWTDVSGETTHTLTTSTSGDYRLRITNPDLPQLEESISKTINVTVT